MQTLIVYMCYETQGLTCFLDILPRTQTLIKMRTKVCAPFGVNCVFMKF